MPKTKVTFILLWKASQRLGMSWMWKIGSNIEIPLPEKQQKTLLEFLHIQLNQNADYRLKWSLKFH